MKKYISIIPFHSLYNVIPIGEIFDLH